MRNIACITVLLLTGLLSGSNRFNTQLAITAVNQAYVQSPYLKK